MEDIQLKHSSPHKTELKRIEKGTLCINAPTLEAAYWGMGYAHALDRGMQMMFMRILGQGRAAELLNAELVNIDVFFRKMNWAEKELLDIEPNLKILLDAYCDGVNQRLLKNPPWEFKYLLGVKPEPWVINDIILLSRMVGFLTLSESQAEIEHLALEMIQAKIPIDKLIALFGDNLRGVNQDLIQQVVLTHRVVPENLSWLTGVPRMMASNNWVISGERTKSGKPVLANDPHLEVNRIPSVWTELIIELPDQVIVGGSMPGIPGILIGRNRDISWGVTYAFMDAIDSWIEEVKDGSFKRENSWVPFTKRKEIIKVKKSDPLKVTFYENMHGTLDGDPDLGFKLCTRWASSNSGIRSLKANLNLLNSKNAIEAAEHLAQFETAWNWVIADNEGNIAYQMSGLMPVRKPGWNGFLPGLGWDPSYDWRGMVDPLKLSSCINPGSGYFVTANQDLNSFSKVDPINMPMGDYRARRITELIESIEKHDVESCRFIQNDVYSIQAREFMDIIKPLLPDTPAGKALLEWDFSYDIASFGATLFENLYSLIRKELFSPIIGTEVYEYLVNETTLFIDFYKFFDDLLLSQRSPWHEERTREEIFREAVRKLPPDLGPRWGEVNQITLNHILLGGKLPKSLGFDIGPIELKGGRATPSQGQIYKSAGRITSFAPSIRFAVDLDNQGYNSNYLGGPSDRRFSKYYSNGISDWLSNTFTTVTLKKDSDNELPK